MHNYDELLRACGLLIARHGRLDRLESHNEYWLETEAALRTDFNIIGVKNDAIRQIKAKSEMKRLFAEAGVACARGKVVESLQEALDYARELGFPVVLKPDVGVGAANTWKAESEEHLSRLFGQKPDVPYILEEFVSGQICTFDGLTDRNGQIVFCTSMVYSQGVMEVVNSNDHIYYYTVRDIPTDLEEAGRKVVTTFDVKERFFHLEFFRSADNRLVALEVNMRPPGGPSIDMMNYTHDIDLFRQWARVIVYNHFNAPVQANYFCGYIGRKAQKHYQYSHQDILHAFGEYIVDTGSLPQVFREAMGDSFYLCRTEDEGDLLEIAHTIQA